MIYVVYTKLCHRACAKHMNRFRSSLLPIIERLIENKNKINYYVLMCYTVCGSVLFNIHSFVCSSPICFTMTYRIDGMYTYGVQDYLNICGFFLSTLIA